MNLRYHYLNLQKLKAHRNGLLLLLAGSVILNLVQGIGMVLSLLKEEKIIVSPPVLTESFWIEGRQVSASYLEQLSDYFARLMLNVTPHTAEVRRDAVLSLVAPWSYGTIRATLLKDEQDIKEKGVSSAFSPVKLEVDPEKLEVLVVGDLVVWLGPEKVKSERKAYRVQFVSGNSTIAHPLLIEAFSEVQDYAEF